MIHIVERSTRNLHAGWLLRALSTQQPAHGDMKRQRSRKQRTKELAQARTVKGQYVPLCFVTPPMTVREVDAYIRRQQWR